MRKILLFLAFILSVCISKAQAPSQLNFQGVARNLLGNALINQPIKIRLSIQTAAIGGVTEYTETRSLTTNAVGLFSVVIGSAGATSSSGNIANIIWNVGSRFLLLEMDISGGNNFVSMGSTQFQSVPYALYANTSGTATNVSGVVSVINGGTGSTSLALNHLLIGNGTNPLQTLAPGTSGNVVRSNGTTWTSSPATYWDLTGNANSAASNFIGTTDTKPLSFRVNNTWSGQIHHSNGNTSYGFNAFNSSSNGVDNTANGQAALQSNTTGSYNSANGQGALTRNTTGSYNTANGQDALTRNISGFFNTADGTGVLQSNTAGARNTATGAYALNNNTTASGNTAIGNEALVNSKTGSFNTASGEESLLNNTTGANNTANGKAALSSNTTGDNNTAIGNGADVSANNLTNATAIGNGAIVNANNKVRIGNNSVTAIDVAGQLKVNANGANNDFTLPGGRGTTGQVLTTDGAGTATWTSSAGTYWGLTGNAVINPATNFMGTIVAQPLSFRVNNTWSGQIHPSNGNTSYGLNAFNITSTGINNTANGQNALNANTTGFSNTANGQGALSSNTTGSNNTAIGNGADVSANNLTNATAIGNGAIVDAINKVRIGNNSITAIDVAGQLKVNANGASNDFTLPAGRGTSGQVLSTNGAGTTAWTSSEATNWGLTGNYGTEHTINFVGTTDAQPLSFRVNNTWSGQIDPSNGNTSYGLNAFNIASTGIKITAIGQGALLSNTTGVSNTAIGQSALNSNTSGGSNTAIGQAALSGNTTGGSNTALGFNANVSTGALSNATAIGNGAIVDASNKVRIGNNSVTAIDVAGQLKVNANGATNDFTLPSGRGTTGQILSTDGAGTTSWIAAVGSSGWSLTGNQNTIAATNFIGTTDAKPLSFRVNNTWSGQIDPSNGNTSYGLNAFNSVSTGVNITAIGQGALLSNTTGVFNTAIGQGALNANTTGGSNTANGQSALFSSTTGFSNTANGQSTLFSNTTGSNNTANGANALSSNSTGGGNTANGATALSGNTTGSNNTAIGNGANVSSGALSNATAIGNGAIVDAINKVRIGNNSVTAIDVAGQLKVNANGASNDFTLPAGRGTTGQVLSTNGSGVTSWATAAGGLVSGFTHYLGEDFNNGIIYYLYKGRDGLEHGLIVSKTESTTAAWQTTGSLLGANRTEEGAFNTVLMTNSANSPAASYISTLGTGWYLPSVDELNLLYYNRYSAQKGLRAGGFTLLANASEAFYWSSTEFFAANAYSFSFSNGQPNTSFNKTNNTISVRGISAF